MANEKTFTYITLGILGGAMQPMEGINSVSAINLASNSECTIFKGVATVYPKVDAGAVSFEVSVLSKRNPALVNLWNSYAYKNGYKSIPQNYQISVFGGEIMIDGELRRGNFSALVHNITTTSYPNFGSQDSMTEENQAVTYQIQGKLISPFTLIKA